MNMAIQTNEWIQKREKNVSCNVIGDRKRVIVTIRSDNVQSIQRIGIYGVQWCNIQAMNCFSFQIYGRFSCHLSLYCIRQFSKIANRIAQQFVLSFLSLRLFYFSNRTFFSETFKQDFVNVLSCFHYCCIPSIPNYDDIIAHDFSVALVFLTQSFFDAYFMAFYVCVYFFYRYFRSIYILSSLPLFERRVCTLVDPIFFDHTYQYVVHAAFK